MKPALTVIAGPTASGKSALAIECAQRLGAEIVSADSQQVYRRFDIGTAKPSEAQLAAIPHHLISVADPLEEFSAARFQQLADAAIADISGRGRPVVVVGGTGLYLRILLHGVVAAPGADPGFRQRLEHEAQLLGPEELHRRLRAVDPESADLVQPADRMRIVRALEIHHLTGRPASAFRNAHRFAEARYPFRMFVLNPRREELYEAINRRTREIFEHGLVEEVRRLVAEGYRDAAPMGSVGYVQALAVLEGRMTQGQAIEDTAQKTRHYAKRQLTWFRKEAGARWVAPPYDAALCTP